MIQTVLLRSNKHYGRQVPAQSFGRVLSAIPEMVRQSVRMRLEGQSSARGKRPNWLKAASDIRFIGHDGNNDTILHFEAPTLGEAAPHLYAQPELWQTRPEPSDTGFDLLADVLVDVAARNDDSERYDRMLLGSLEKTKNIWDGAFCELVVRGHRKAMEREISLTPAVAKAARDLRINTPIPQRVRIVGRLDMLRVSTRAFGVILEDGQEIRGVLTNTDPDAESLSQFMNQRVLILGQAVYRPSGKLLRVDAEGVTKASDQDSFFSRVPNPMWKSFSLRDVLRRQHRKSGVAAIIGKWPGDETDEQITEALNQLG